MAGKATARQRGAVELVAGLGWLNGRNIKIRNFLGRQVANSCSQQNGQKCESIHVLYANTERARRMDFSRRI